MAWSEDTVVARNFTAADEETRSFATACLAVMFSPS